MADSRRSPQVSMPASILATPIHLNDGNSLRGDGVCPLQAADLVRCEKNWRERNEKQVAQWLYSSRNAHPQSEEECTKVREIHTSGVARNAATVHRITCHAQSR